MLTPPIQRSSNEQKKVDRQAGYLTLYDCNQRPFNNKIQRHLRQLNVSVTVKNLNRCHTFQKELLSGGGRAQVPCLRIDTSSGSRWLYESDDIIQYLDRKFLPKAQSKGLERAH
ncbi:glutathione S-transferase N-terminal domain-containing protein [Oceaniserpentilla sp. 4NH20-0058]|uniref:glutathione S-transferase N-terminal domain-containing protein n=1 Tax=Oceaniserpentilla sp. 4NH20-0058 TaxID=3127660 RepID=UPI003341959B